MIKDFITPNSIMVEAPPPLLLGKGIIKEEEF
jgi:hypothetical protein